MPCVLCCQMEAVTSPPPSRLTHLLLDLLRDCAGGIVLSGHIPSVATPDVDAGLLAATVLREKWSRESVALAPTRPRLGVGLFVVPSISPYPTDEALAIDPSLQLIALQCRHLAREAVNTDSTLVGCPLIPDHYSTDCRVGTRDSFPTVSGAGLVDLGPMALRGLDAPVRLFSNATKYSPTSGKDRGNLPRTSTPLRGRARDFLELRHQLYHNDRIVALSGPHGIGKSRLALAVARDLEPEYERPPAWVDLSGCESVEEVVHAVATTLRIELPDGSELGLFDAIATDDPRLMVLDGADAAFETVQQLGRRLKATNAGLQICITSSRVVPSSTVWVHRLAPLSTTPRTTNLSPAGEMMRDLLAPERTLSPSEREAIERLVVGLDGMPEAIRVAAQLPHESLESLADRLCEGPQGTPHLWLLSDAVEHLAEPERAVLWVLWVAPAPLLASVLDTIVKQLALTDQPQTLRDRLLQRGLLSETLGATHVRVSLPNLIRKQLTPDSQWLASNGDRVENTLRAAASESARRFLDAIGRMAESDFESAEVDALHWIAANTSGALALDCTRAIGLLWRYRRQPAGLEPHLTSLRSRAGSDAPAVLAEIAEVQRMDGRVALARRNGMRAIEEAFGTSFDSVPVEAMSGVPPHQIRMVLLCLRSLAAAHPVRVCALLRSLHEHAMNVADVVSACEIADTIAVQLRRERNRPGAVEWNAVSIELAQGADLQGLMPTYLQTKANLSLDRGALADARDCYREAIELATTFGDQIVLKNATHNLSVCFLLLGDTLGSWRFCKRSLDLLHDGPLRLSAHAHLQYAVLHRHLGNARDALEALDRASALERRLHDPDLEERILRARCSTQLDVLELSSAGAGLERWKRLRPNTKEPEALGLLAIYELLVGRMSEARSHTQSAIARAPDNPQWPALLELIHALEVAGSTAADTAAHARIAPESPPQAADTANTPDTLATTEARIAKAWSLLVLNRTEPAARLLQEIFSSLDMKRVHGFRRVLVFLGLAVAHSRSSRFQDSEIQVQRIRGLVDLHGIRVESSPWMRAFWDEVRAPSLVHEGTQVAVSAIRGTEPVRALPPSTNRIRFERHLGSGSFGDVFLAHDELRHLAVKMLRRGGLGRDDSVAEARLLAGLPPHPNVVTIHYLTEVEGRFALAMEYLDGPTLQQRGERNALSLREVVRIGQQLAKGISFLHDHCLLHRDVKPQNVIETHAGRVVLTDFGLAANFDPTERAWEIPPAGTMAYMAPEVAVDSRPPSRASDSYSLVATLFFLVCRHPPAEGESFSDVRRQLSHGIRPALPEGIPNDWTLFFDRGLARVPAARFQTGAEVDEALAALEV